MNLKPLVILLAGVSVVLIACGLATIVAGVKQLREQRRRLTQPQAVIWWWLYLGIGTLFVIGVLIFLYAR